MLKVSVLIRFINKKQMGNSNDGMQRNNNFKDFNMQKYMNQGLNQEQILQIR